MSQSELQNFIETQLRLPVGDETLSVQEPSKYLKRVQEHRNASMNVVYIDVTDTDSCPIITGIQRVVRQVVNCFIANNIPCELIRYDFDTRGFVVLTNEEREIFLKRLDPDSEKPPKSWSSIVNDALYFFMKYFGRFISAKLRSFGDFGIFAELRDGAELSKAGLVRKIRSRKKREFKLIPLQPVKGMRILLPELIYEKGRADQYLALKRYFNADISIIVYDLIPLYHPELTEVSREFLYFLQVVRIARKAIAISEYSAEQISSYLEGWSRGEGSETPIVEPIYLPFSALGGITKEDKFEKPTFLFVSTIEPRKNHLRLVSAAKKLKDMGYDFRLLCVGKIGWVDNNSWTEVERLCRDGAPVEFMHRVDDSQLRELLLKSWCAIYPSLVEGFGLPIIEADQFGLPVIASNNSAMRDVCMKFVRTYRFIEPDDSDSILSAMKEFLDSSTTHFTKNSSREALPQSWNEYSNLIYRSILRNRLSSVQTVNKND